MSDMKCPFCNGELVGTIGHPICRNQNCVMCDDPMPQDLLEELICTRKALEVAKDRLDTVRQYHRRTAVIGPNDIAAYCDRAIEQITAILENKNDRY